MREKKEGSRRFDCVWQEASVATFAVYDRNGKRVKTFHLGRVPESLQATLSLEIKGFIETSARNMERSDAAIALRD